MRLPSGEPSVRSSYPSVAAEILSEMPVYGTPTTTFPFLHDRAQHANSRVSVSALLAIGLASEARSTVSFIRGAQDRTKCSWRHFVEQGESAARARFWPFVVLEYRY